MIPPDERDPVAGGAVNPIPWADFSAEVLALYAPPLRAASTRDKVRQALRQVAALGVASTAEIGPQLVARFVAAQPPANSPNTTRGLLSSLRACCNYALDQGYCRASPFNRRRRWVRASAPLVKKFHSREEIARVLDMMRRDVGRKARGGWAEWRARRLYALASTVAYTGLRKMEALRLRVEDIDLPGRMLLIVERSGGRLKTVSSAAPVPLPDALVPVLAEWLPHLVLPASDPADDIGPAPRRNPGRVRDAGWVFPNVFRTGPWTGGSPGHDPLDRMKAAGLRAGVEGFTFLSLRHSFATHAEYWGLSDTMIQRILRHTSVRTQLHYRHAETINMRAKVAGLTFGHELSAPEAEAAALAAAPPVPPPPPPADVRPPGSVDRSRKLDPAAAAELRRLREGGWSYKALCERFGVSKATVNACVYRVTHKDAPSCEDAPS
jgi:integrase